MIKIAFYSCIIEFFILLLFRKNASYISFGGIYLIELFFIIQSILFFVSIFFKFSKFFLPPNFFIFLIIITIYVVYNFFIFLIDPGPLQNFILGFYPIYFIFYYILFYNFLKVLKINFVVKINKFLIICIFLSLITNFLFKDLEIIYAGNTFIFAFIFILAVFFVSNIFYLVTIFSLFFLNFLSSLERAILVNTFIPLFANYRTILKSKKNFIISLVLGFLILFVFILYFNIISSFLGLNNLRFEINLVNILDFVKSIWDSNIEMEEGGAIGTRNHRLDMWLEVISKSYVDFRTLFFGNGFNNKIVENDFNGIPHNGFISILHRSGYIGVIIFIYFLYTLIYFIKKNRMQNSNLSAFIISVLIAFVFEIFTGTIIDSPFTSLLAYQILSYSTVNLFINFNKA